MVAATSTGKLLLLPVAAIILVLAYKALVRLDRSRHRSVILTVIVGLLLFESVFYQDDTVSGGILHPNLAGQNLRLYDIVIPLALAARLRARGRPLRIGIPGLLWATWAAWYLVCAVVGKLNGHSFTDINFEMKAVLYILGGMMLVSGFSIDELLSGSGILRLVRPAAVLTLVVGPLTLLHASPKLHITALSVVGPVSIGADSAEILVCLGALGLITEICKTRPSPSQLLASGVLLVGSVLAGQRAAMISLVVVLGLTLVAAVLPTARRRIQATAVDVVLVLLAVLSLIIAIPIAQNRSPWSTSSIPLAHQIENALHSEAKAQSAQQRLNQLHAVEAIVPERLFFGWGLGRKITYYATGQFQLANTDISHDVATDLLMRSGLVGLSLFVASIAVTLASMLRVWQRAREPRVAAAALAAAVVVLALLGLGVVESLLENFRLALLLGITLGIGRSMATGTGPDGSILEFGHRSAASAPPVS